MAAGQRKRGPAEWGQARCVMLRIILRKNAEALAVAAQQ